MERKNPFDNEYDNEYDYACLKYIFKKMPGKSNSIIYGVS